MRARGRLSFTKQKGEYQLIASEALEPVGAGAFSWPFERQRARLRPRVCSPEGLKRAIPLLPRASA